MKMLRWLVPLALIALVLSVGAAAVSAATGTPVGAPYVDNSTHSIAPSTSTWYRFEYAGDHSQVTVSLVNAKGTGVGFEVYTPTQMNKWWDTDPIGVGSPQDNDLVWNGNSHEGGTWSILVINKNPGTTTYQLVVNGKGVTFAPPTVTQPVPAPVVPQPSVSPSTNALPTQARAVDASPQVILPNSTLWYTFYNDGTRDQMIITLVNGSDEHLRMHIHTPSQIVTWWDTDPIGQGNKKGADLIWNGSSNEAGNWYVEVMNDNTYAVGFQVTLQVLQNTAKRY